MNIKKMIYLILGCIGLGIGAVGAAVPMLPSFPFLLLAAFSFAKSSEKLHHWFIHTKLYKNNLESYLQGRGMAWPAKIRIMVAITLLMAFGFIMMLLKELYIPCGILFFVWVLHILYFTFRVKNCKQ